MSLVEGFLGIVLCGKLGFEVEALSPLTIGSGREALDPVAPDIPLLRDSMGRPLIPGSTMKGFVRSGIERILSGRGISGYMAFLGDLMGRTAPEAYGSRLLFSDAPVDEGRGYRISAREHVALDPSRMTVRHGPFRQEYVEPGAIFKGTLSFRNIPLSFLSLLDPVARLAELGVFRMGRSKSRGYGHIRISWGNPEVFLPLKNGAARFSINLSSMGRNVLVTASRSGDEVTIKDNLSGCELRGKVKEEWLMTRLDVRWDDVAGCVEKLLGGLRG